MTNVVELRGKSISLANAKGDGETFAVDLFFDVRDGGDRLEIARSTAETLADYASEVPKDEARALLTVFWNNCWRWRASSKRSSWETLHAFNPPPPSRTPEGESPIPLWSRSASRTQNALARSGHPLSL